MTQRNPAKRVFKRLRLTEEDKYMSNAVWHNDYDMITYFYHSRNWYLACRDYPTISVSSEAALKLLRYEAN